MGVPGYGTYVYTLDHASNELLNVLASAWKPSVDESPQIHVPVDALKRLWTYAVRQGWEV